MFQCLQVIDQRSRLQSMPMSLQISKETLYGFTRMKCRLCNVSVGLRFIKIEGSKNSWFVLSILYFLCVVDKSQRWSGKNKISYNYTSYIFILLTDSFEDYNSCGKVCYLFLKKFPYCSKNVQTRWKCTE